MAEAAREIKAQAWKLREKAEEHGGIAGLRYHDFARAVSRIVDDAVRRGCFDRRDAEYLEWQAMPIRGSEDPDELWGAKWEILEKVRRMAKEVPVCRRR